MRDPSVVVDLPIDDLERADGGAKASDASCLLCDKPREVHPQAEEEKKGQDDD